MKSTDDGELELRQAVAVLKKIVDRITVNSCVEADREVQILSEAPRLISNIVGMPLDEVACDMPVEIVYEAAGEWIVPKFKKARGVIGLA